MSTPESWRGEAERLARYAHPAPMDDFGFVAGRLATDPRFRSGWNSALWEIHKMVDDGINITRALLSDMASR